MKKSDADDKSDAIQSRMSKTAKIIARNLMKCVLTYRKDLSEMLDKLAYREGMTRTEAKLWLNSPTPPEVQMDLMQKAKESGDFERYRKTLLSYNYNKRKALLMALEIHLRKYADYIRKGIVPVFTDTAYEAYGRAWYEIQKGARVGFTMTAFPVKTLQETLSGHMNYTFTTYLTAQTIGKPLKDALFKGILTGSGWRSISKEISEVTGVIPWKAKAIARTSLTEIANNVEAQTLDEAGLKNYRYMCTLDERTCPVCGALDGKMFPVKEGRIGVNRPPMHPNCRCTTTAAFTKDTLAVFQRSAKNERGKWITLDGSITYEEWSRRYLKGKRQPLE